MLARRRAARKLPAYLQHSGYLSTGRLEEKLQSLKILKFDEIELFANLFFDTAEKEPPEVSYFIFDGAVVSGEYWC